MKFFIERWKVACLPHEVPAVATIPPIGNDGGKKLFMTTTTEKNKYANLALLNLNCVITADRLVGIECDEGEKEKWKFRRERVVGGESIVWQSARYQHSISRYFRFDILRIHKFLAIF